MVCHLLAQARGRGQLRGVKGTLAEHQPADRASGDDGGSIWLVFFFAYCNLNFEYNCFEFYSGNSSQLEIFLASENFDRSWALGKDVS